MFAVSVSMVMSLCECVCQCMYQCVKCFAYTSVRVCLSMHIPVYGFDCPPMLIPLSVFVNYNSTSECVCQLLYHYMSVFVHAYTPV